MMGSRNLRGKLSVAASHVYSKHLSGSADMLAADSYFPVASPDHCETWLVKARSSVQDLSAV